MKKDVAIIKEEMILLERRIVGKNDEHGEA